MAASQLGGLEELFPGLAAQPPAVQAGARHAAQACRLSPSLRLCLHTHNRTLYPVQLRFLGSFNISTLQGEMRDSKHSGKQAFWTGPRAPRKIALR